ncbi:hypothetical protein [Marivirga sp.]|uniref:hypothetical protein n=1 Tax=Marivirga sp. TaxID=2018662 RepID=UPI002D7F83E9|nr:hypothetical protein [Marivirga sp.]HET8861096.1 hypothetical protein [Marivirga sp.]
MKKEIIEKCRQELDTKKQNISREIEAIIYSMGSDTKSSAGDKYETGREMMNQEKEKLRAQLSVIDRQLDSLNQINFNNNFDKVSFGAMVKTSVAAYFISISYGKITIENTDLFMISAVTPFAQILKGKKAGEKVNWNGKDVLIVEVN